MSALCDFSSPIFQEDLLFFLVTNDELVIMHESPEFNNETVEEDAYLSETDSVNLQFSFESPNLQAVKTKSPPVRSTSAPSQNSFSTFSSTVEEIKKKRKSTISVPPSWSSYKNRQKMTKQIPFGHQKEDVLSSEVPESSPVLPELNLTTVPSPEIEVYIFFIMLRRYCLKLRNK